MLVSALPCTGLYRLCRSPILALIGGRERERRREGRAQRGDLAAPGTPPTQHADHATARQASASCPPLRTQFRPKGGASHSPGARTASQGGDRGKERSESGGEARTSEIGMRFGQRGQGGDDMGGGEGGAKARIRELRAEGREGKGGRERPGQGLTWPPATCRGLRATCTFRNFACLSSRALPLTFARMGQRDRRSCARVNWHNRELSGIGCVKQRWAET